MYTKARQNQSTVDFRDIHYEDIDLELYKPENYCVSFRVTKPQLEAWVYALIKLAPSPVPCSELHQYSLHMNFYSGMGGISPGTLYNCCRIVWAFRIGRYLRAAANTAPSSLLLTRTVCSLLVSPSLNDGSSSLYLQI